MNYKGKILISSPDISGDIFSRSVVFILEHDDNGALGFILNKKQNENRLSFFPKYDIEFLVYQGGPVEINIYFFLVKDKIVKTDSTKKEERFHLTNEVDFLIDKLIKKEIVEKDIKVFAGYSGWTAGQLEEEISNKSWTICEQFSLDYILQNDKHLWRKMMQNLGGEFLIWANAPEDISLN